MLADKPRHAVFTYVLRNIDPKLTESILLDVGLAHKKAKRWQQAVDCLRHLIQTDIFDTELSYALSLCDLKASHKNLEPHFRANCHALRGFQSLFRRKPDELLKKLVADRALDAADLYYLGFHFSDGSYDQKDFGEGLLKAIVRRWPKSKEAKAVRQRLKLKRAPATKKAPAKKKVVKKTPVKKKATTKKKTVKAPSKKKAAGKKKAAAKKAPAKKKAAPKKSAAKPSPT